MAMTKCPECGHQISSSAKVCPNCGKKDPLVTVGSRIGAVVILIIGSIVLYSYVCQPTEKSVPTSSGTVKRSSLAYPPQQQSFHQAIASFPMRYDVGVNEIQKSAVFNACNDVRQREAKKLGYKLDQWVGQVEEIRTDQGGEYAYIKIAAELCGIKVVYQTYNNTFSDMDDHTMLEKGTSAYDAAGALTPGAAVRFTAKFIRDTDRGISEGSLTEEGCVDVPEFIVHFQSIALY